MTTMYERAKDLGMVDAEGFCFDFATPAPWADEVKAKTGLWPHGIVWLYDKVAPIWGRPFPITMYGWWICRLMNYDIPAITPET